MSPTHTITLSTDGSQSITCHTCGLTSHNPNDVHHRYCGKCCKFLDDPSGEHVSAEHFMAFTAWCEDMGADKTPLQGNFDPDDGFKIKTAWALVGMTHTRLGQVFTGLTLTEEQQHIADCISRAVRGFHRRLAMRRPIWEVKDGEWFFKICQPATYFDSFVVKLVIQDIASGTGRGVALGRMQPGPDAGPMFGRNPDVIFKPKVKV